MWVLPLVGYVGLGLGFCFLTLAIASGLYYLSELVEEHTVIAKKLLTRLIFIVMGVQILLCFVDGFPFTLSMLSIVSHVVYLGNMRKFPIVKLSDPLFVSSCVLVLINHWVWFKHFSSSDFSSPRNRYDYSNLPTFTEIASYFGLCVWLVPFSLFVSLSAGDNVLPTMGSEAPGMGDGGDGKNKRQGMIKVLVDTILGWIGEVSKMAGWGGSRSERGFSSL
ncbi:transmembrane adaptor Erv26 [Amylocarpus encephaloides]|uniref:Transmembrane adaptor Erv26 n=1 Tax=Amylocarpus encephaloides TaxID=45428 RepID=A0A9P7YSR4_9HELO|nr:transmembrane adaptor Erv26 [Amylocarpus encephaloides]